MIFVDSGAWFASVVPSDGDHVPATHWLNQNTQLREFSPVPPGEVERHLGLERAFDVHVRLALWQPCDDSREVAHADPPACLSLGTVLKELNQPLQIGAPRRSAVAWSTVLSRL